MENRGFVERTESGASGRRTGIGLTVKGRRAVESAIRGHAGNIRRYFFDPLTPEQAAAIEAWSKRIVDRLEPRCGEAAADGALQIRRPGVHRAVRVSSARTCEGPGESVTSLHTGARHAGPWHPPDPTGT